MPRVRKCISYPRKRSQSAPAVLRSPAKKVKCKQLTDTQMKAALEAVASGSLVNRAAVDHGVPPTTLNDRLAGWVQHGDKPCPKPYLDQHKEKELGDFATVLLSWVWEKLQRCNGHSTICCIVKVGFAQREDQPGMVPGRRAWFEAR